MAKVKRLLGPLAALLGAGAWFHPSVAGSDLWWHLASGREIWRRGEVPREDPFSFTFQGREWLNHEWLWDALLWGPYQLHPQAVAWLNLALLFALFGVVFAVARRASGSTLAAGAALWLAAAGTHWFLDIRPHLLTLLGVAVLLLVRRRSWAPWLWPPLVAAWANLHAGFLFGVGAIGLDVALRTLRASWQAGRLVALRREWLGLGLSLLAMLANPWGYRILEYPLAYLDEGLAFRTLSEWRPTGFSLDPRSFEARFWLLALAAAAGVLAKARTQSRAGPGEARTQSRAGPGEARTQSRAGPEAASGATEGPYLAALAAVSLLMAATSRRFIPLFAVTAAPLVALAFAAVERRLVARWPMLHAPGTRVAASLTAIGIGALLWRGVALYPNLLERWTLQDLYPAAAVRYLSALGPPERLLNLYNWGGYLMLHAPESKVFIDGRANTLYDAEIFEHYVAFLNGEPGTQARLARYPADAALLPHGRFSAALRALPDPWIPVYSDAVALILVPPGSPLLDHPLPRPQQVLEDAPESRLKRALALQRRGELDAAMRELQKLMERHPLFLRGYGQLALLHAERGDVDAIAETIEAGLRAHPRRHQDLRNLEGRAYLRAGDLPRALRAYRRTLPAGPFTNDGERRARIRYLEGLLEQRAKRHMGGERE